MFKKTVFSRPRPESVGGGGARSYNALGSLVSSCVFDLDATIAASYSGSGQTWSNLETTPADSEAQTAYDFYLGADSSSSKIGRAHV
jgi:hypothetical protein